MSTTEQTINPYESPVHAAEHPEPVEREKTIISGSKSAPRFLAAQIDYAFAAIFFFVAAMSLADDRPFQILPALAGVTAYLGYFFVSESFWGGSPGKLLFRLRVRRLTGERCTIRQIGIRTLLRLIEVNPLILGGWPACISIVCTSRRQRIGDLLAGTVVVRV
jgi:uncharacterized RDD family membrane protein YckC